MAEAGVRARSAAAVEQHAAGDAAAGMLQGLAAAYRRHPWWMLALALVLVVILVLAYGGYFLGWDWTGFSGNTFWDWLSLLITPVTIASVSIAFSIQQGRASVETSERQRQDAMIEAYFDHITHLLVEERLLETPLESPVRAAARARTLTALQRASRPHREAIMRFLGECGLTSGDAPVLDAQRLDVDVGSASGLA